jgi:hypothetical protein
MDCGVKRIIKEEDTDSLFDFYSERHSEIVGEDRFQKWLECQRQHFKNKTDIEKKQRIRKEGFIVQEIFKKSPGQDKPNPPKTLGGFILKMAEYKTAEVKGFIIDSTLKNKNDIDKCIIALIRDMEKLCKKEGYDNYLVFASIMNNTAATLFNSHLFHVERISGELENGKQEFVFKRNISPCYMGDPFNWLDKVLWYIKYFIGQEFADLKYRTGLKIEKFDIPIVRHSIIYPKNKFYSTETQEVSASFVIYDDELDDVESFLSTPDFENSKVMFLFLRKKIRNLKNVICISEEKIDNVIRATWEK